MRAVLLSSQKKAPPRGAGPDKGFGVTAVECRSEPHPKLELNVALGTREGSRHLSKIRVLVALVRNRKLRRVCESRGFSAELEFETLRQGNVLEDRDVEHIRARTV